jgi:deazaflavin-dependent oxidoreductase (nitroreductase family)
MRAVLCLGAAPHRDLAACASSAFPSPAGRRSRYDREMRSRKYRLVTTLERASNRLIRMALRAGVAPRAFALLETTGRRSGLARHTPVGNGLDGDTFWLVAAHGTQADYVRNLQAEPRVRVKAGGIWRAGTAVVLPGDDPAARSQTLPHQWDAAIGRMMASAPLTIRIDLDPLPEPR